MNIRVLRADEIECRVQTVKKDGCSVLLYKDARCDMRILDETFGVNGWQRTHELINGNLFCNIDIWDIEKNCWIRKQDVGTESYTEKEKGQASDSFKRAGFNVGIGRELYTSPFIWITLTPNDFKTNSKGESKLNTTFSVADIGYNDKREINKLSISDNKGNIRYTFRENNQDEEMKKELAKKITEKEAEMMISILEKKGKTKEDFIAWYNTNYHTNYKEISEMTKQDYGNTMLILNKTGKKK